MAFSPQTSTNLTKNSLFAIKNVDRAHRTTMPCVYSASVVRQLEVLLFKTARARVTLARMSLALAVQMNGLGLALCTAM